MPDLIFLAEGMRREHTAPRAALTLLWSVGLVEG